MPAFNDNRRGRRFRIACLLIALTPCFALAQQPTQKPTDSDDVVRVTTEIVQTDVSVLDKDGKFVDHLKPEQFQLKVDGRPQAVSFFERVVAGSTDEDAQIAAARGTSRERGADGASSLAAVPLDRGRAVVFFIDDLHLAPASVVYTRKLLQRFIDTQMKQNDQLAIATASNQLGFLSQMTDDKSVLRQAVARLNPRVGAEIVDRERPAMNIAQALAVERRDLSIVDVFVEQTLQNNPGMTQEQAHDTVQRRADMLIDQNSAVVMRTFDSLRGVLRTFAGFPGRKLCYLVSDGFALDFQRNNTYDRLRQLTDAAVRAGAVIYTVDARGLGAQLADMPQAEDSYSFDPANRFNPAGVSLTATTQEPLRTIADETGGRAILNTNSPDLGMARALKETSVYYLLAWRPEHDENRGGKYRRIEVSVKDRPDVTVLVQRGFFATPPDAATSRPDQKSGAGNKQATKSPTTAGAASPEETQRNKELFAALRAPFPRSELPTALTLNYTRTQDAKILLSMSLLVEVEPTKPTPGVTPVPDQAEVLGALYDNQGKVVSTFQNTTNIPPKDTRVEVPKSLQLTFAFQSQVAPGLYQARFASLDPKSHRTGSASQWIDVPDVNGKGFSLSSIFLGVPPPVATDNTQTVIAGAQVLVVPDRRFPRGGTVRFLFYAYNATLGADAKPDIAIQVQVFRDDQPVITAPLRKLNTEGFKDFSRLPYAAELSLASVPSGRYLLRITAIDRVAKISASQNIKFSID
jgi:VWFA-related protein